MTAISVNDPVTGSADGAPASNGSDVVGEVRTGFVRTSVERLTGMRLGASQRKRHALPLSGVTVAVFAIVVCFADGFWATSLHGTVGAIDRVQGPFKFWERTSTLMLPVFVGAVIAAMLIARRLVGRSRTPFVKPAVAALFIVLMCTIAAAAQLTGSAIKDYRQQVSQLQAIHATHDTLGSTQAGASRTDGPVSPAPIPKCDALCASEHDTKLVHIKAVKLGTLRILLTNLVLVPFLMVFRGDLLWGVTRRLRVRSTRVATSATTSSEDSVLLPQPVGAAAS